MKKTWIGAAAAVAALIVYVFVDQWGSTPVEGEAPLGPAYVAAEGKVEAMPGFDVDISTGELNGRLAKILVKAGDQVRQGQVVAVLENEDLQAQVTRAERQLAVARSQLIELESGARQQEILAAAATLEGAMASMQEAWNQLRRYRELHQQRLITLSTLDECEAAFKASHAAVKEAEQRKQLLEEGPKLETERLYRDQVRLAEAALNYERKRLAKTILRSPLAGTLVERYLYEGEGVTPEIPILAIANLSKLWINAEVDETDVERIHEGDAVQVSSNAYPGMMFKGAIRRIEAYVGERKIRPSNPAVNLGLKVIQVKVEFREPTPLRLGMTVDMRMESAGL